MATVTVGVYRFTDTDVRKTIHHATDLLDLYPPDAQTLQASRRARLTSAIEGDDFAAVWAELVDARADLVMSQSLPATATGSIEQVSASGGGVPKLPLPRVEVGFGGVVGDRQASRVHHGRPWQALCLWSREVIDQLRAEGHPIDAGSAGENITIVGLPWPEVGPGVRLRLGTVLCQVMAFAVPCKQNAQWFSDGNFNRIHHRNGPISRVYALVLEPGVIAPGDAAILEPM